MKTSLGIAIIATMLTALTPLVHAGQAVLISAPVSNDGGGISCVITNAGKKAVTVAKIETVGSALGTNTLDTDITLQPGAFIGEVDNENLGYCRFTIDKAAKTVRAETCRFEAGSGPGTNLDCVEAR